ncbi:GmrSD restriction endonuclease domain-containing protein [Mangrovibrevibacter kandeliae]|uniref:GmrSD restriction endonuclease domain-containing protein n=1 Tax=Mangrovibrevibacter kandeliae TaxID=2968473 RepID=UPI002118EE18|nr:DUF262 domain-containing protein [Aurantimonas sp. CSK15Z-1]MCQ8783685.1 DUF262 domain-containing protein [Aurantimonas sp. CSK15Z-1]
MADGMEVEGAGMATVAIRTALERILSGSIRIPAFQRGFVWTTDNISFLMDSIYRNYPIGSILLWRTKDALEKERDLGPFSLPVPEKDYPVDYVLDGQQRLTSIFSVFQTTLSGKSSTEAFDIYFDLQAPEGALEDQFVSIFEPGSDPSRYFPLRAIFDTATFFEIASGLSSDNKNKVVELQRRFQEFQLNLDVIEFENKDEIAIIFERVNRAGIRLDAFQLLSAWTWSSEFDLNESISELAQDLEPFGFHELSADPNLMMKCFAAVIKGDAQLKDVVSLHGPTVRERFEEIKRGILGAIDFLKKQLLVESLSLMPYPAMLVPLSAFFATPAVSGIHPSDKQREAIIRWYWRSCLSRRYSSGVGRAHAADIALMNSLKSGSQIDILKSVRPIDPSFFIENRFAIGNVNSKILINLLSQKRPASLLSGAKIDLAVVLQKGNKNEFHHIFPRAHLKKSGLENDKINAIANICFLSKSDNNRIKDKDPSVYVSMITADKKEEILDTNLIPVGFESLTYDEFLDKRSEIIAGFANALAELS